MLIQIVYLCAALGSVYPVSPPLGLFPLCLRYLLLSYLVVPFWPSLAALAYLHHMTFLYIESQFPRLTPFIDLIYVPL